MTTKFITAIEEVLETKYPQHQDCTLVSLDNLKFKIFLPRTVQLLASYTNILSLTLKHCDLRNLQNFPRLLFLQQLDCSHNQIQGTLNNLMPLRKLKYLNIQSNIISESSKLAPLRKIVAGSIQKNFKIHICIKNNPFLTEESNYLSKLKTYGLKVIKQQNEYVDKKKADEQKILQKSKQLLLNKKKLIKKDRNHRIKPRGYFAPQVDSSSNSSDLSSNQIQSPQYNSDFQQIPVPMIRLPTNHRSDISSNNNHLIHNDIPSINARNRIADHMNMHSRMSSYNSNNSQINSRSGLLSLRTVLGENINAQRVGGRIIVRLDSSNPNRNGGRQLLGGRQLPNLNDNSEMQFQRIGNNQEEEELEYSEQEMMNMFTLPSGSNRQSLFRNQSNESVIRFDSIRRSSNIGSIRESRNSFIQMGLPQQRSLRNSISIRERLERTLAQNEQQLNRLRSQRQSRQRQRQAQRQRQQLRLQNLIAQRQQLLQRQSNRLSNSMNNSVGLGINALSMFGQDPGRQNIYRAPSRSSNMFGRQSIRQQSSNNNNNISNLIDSLNRTQRLSSNLQQTMNRRVNHSQSLNQFNPLNPLSSIQNNTVRANLSNSSSEIMLDNLQDDDNVQIQRFAAQNQQDDQSDQENEQDQDNNNDNDQQQQQQQNQDEDISDSPQDQDNGNIIYHHHRQLHQLNQLNQQIQDQDNDNEQEEQIQDDEQEQEMINPFLPVNNQLFAARVRHDQSSNGNQNQFIYPFDQIQEHDHHFGNQIDYIVERSQSEEVQQNIHVDSENQRSQINQSQNDQSSSSDPRLF